jgi:hypothetical protein
MDLAETLNLPYTTLLAWLDQPHIERLLNQHHCFTALCETNRARQTQCHVSTALTTDFHETEDPKERRRIAAPLLRASAPTRIPASRTTTIRAKAGAEPVSAAGGAGVPPAAAREASAPTHPNLHTLPAPIAQAWTEADNAITAFSHSPPRIPKQAFLETLTTHAESWESHHARASADPDTDPFANTQEARPLAQPAPSPDNPPRNSTRTLISASPSGRGPANGGGEGAAAPITTHNPTPLTSSPPHLFTSSHPSASQTISTLLASLKNFSLSPAQARQALTSIIAPTFTYEGTPFDTDLNRAKVLRGVQNAFDKGAPQPFDLPEPTPEAIAAATTETPLTLSTKIRIRRGDSATGHLGRHIFTLTRAGPDHPWQLQSIARPQPPPSATRR